MEIGSARRKGRGYMKQRNKKITERRKRRVLSGIIGVVLVAAMGLGMFLNFETKVQAAPNTVVDPNTTNVWSDIAANSNSTENIGRIWTDKSVFNKNYDFEGALEGKSVMHLDFRLSHNQKKQKHHFLHIRNLELPLQKMLKLI